MKLCKDCVWHELGNQDPENAICRRRRHEERSRVTGAGVPKKSYFTYCKSNRESGIFNVVGAYIFGYCGPQGRWFEPKKTTKGQA